MQEKQVRNKQLTNQQLETLRNHPQFLQINKSEFVLYNIVNKGSNSGLFKNQRLLILDVIEESLCYLSKLPQGLLPFQRYQEVKDQQPKQWVHQNQIFEDNVNKFTCQKMADKNAIQIKLAKKDKKLQWVYYFANKEVMNEWYAHISFLFVKSREQINQFYHSVHMPPHIQQPQVKLQNKSRQQSVIYGLNDSKMNQNLKKSNLSKEHEKSLSINKPLSQSQKSYKPKQQKSQKIEANDNVNNSEQSFNFIKNKEADSQFKQFDQQTPLGLFLRQNQQQQVKKLVDSGHAYDSNQIEKQKQSKKEISTIKQESLENSKKRTNRKDNSLNESRQFKMQEQSLSGLQYRPISRHTRIYQQENSEKLNLSRGGSIKKQRPLNNQSPQRHKKWKSLYQRSNNKAEVYFEFVQESIKNGMYFVNLLITNQKRQLQNPNDIYGRQVLNGIEYIIGFKELREEMLLYQTSDQQPIVYDLYDDIRRFRQNFYSIKQNYAVDSENSSLPLSILLEYKLIPVLCLTCADRQYSFESKKEACQFEAQDFILKRMSLGGLNITSTLDFRDEMRKGNTGNLNWGYMYKNTKSNYLKEIFLAQIFCEIFLNVLKSELYHLCVNFPKEQKLPGSKDLDDILGKCSLHLIRRLLTQSQKSQQMWELIKAECQRLYNINAKRDDINQNYLLFAILENSGLHNSNQKIKTNNKLLPLATYWSTNEVIVGFKPIIHCLQYQRMSSKMQQIMTIVTQNNQKYHKQLLAYRDEVIQQVPRLINYLQLEINLALTSSYSHKISVSREIYQILDTRQPSNFNFLTAIAKIRWLLREGCNEEAAQLASEKIQLITFYVGKSPLLVKFYEAFSFYQLKDNQYEKAITNIKRQLQILNEGLGVDCEPALLKRLELCDVYIQMNKREECLKELNQAKKICQTNNITENSVYKNILSKLSKVFLNMGKYNDCINSTLINLKQLQKQPLSFDYKQAQAKALQFLKVVELLSRAFELAKRKEQQIQLVKLSVQRCKQTHSYKVYCKLLKLALYPFLKKLPMIQSQALLGFVEKIQDLNLFSKMTQRQLLSMISKTNLLDNLQLKILNQLKSLKLMNEKIYSQKTLQKLNVIIENNEQQATNIGQLYEFTMNWILIVKIVTPGFIQSLAKDNYYQ